MIAYFEASPINKIKNKNREWKTAFIWQLIWVNELSPVIKMSEGERM